MLCTERPTIFGLMTREAGSPIASNVFEKGVRCRACEPARLEGCNFSAWVDTYLQLWDNGWSFLTPGGWIWKKPPHLLGMLSGARTRRGSPVGFCRLGSCKVGNATNRSGPSQYRRE
jgi:hypothetical protein